MTYEEFVNFMNGLRKKVHPLKKSINDQAFTTKKRIYEVLWCCFHR